MKVLVTFLSVLVMCGAQDYLDMEDGDFDASVLSIDQMRGVANCLIERGPCDPVSGRFKQQYPLAIQNACQGCSVAHRHALSLFFYRLMNELPDEFDAFLRLYDPEGRYFDGFYNSFKDY